MKIKPFRYTFTPRRFRNTSNVPKGATTGVLAIVPDDNHDATPLEVPYFYQYAEDLHPEIVERVLRREMGRKTAMGESIRGVLAPRRRAA